MLIHSEEVDRRLNWPLGKAERLARRRKLPHYVLPDGAIRFRWEEIETLIKRVDTSTTPADCASGNTGQLVNDEDMRRRSRSG